jgi:hypothetical protein
VRIQLRYGGGLAGEEVLLRDVETSALAPEQAVRVEDAIGAFERGEVTGDVGADMFEYRIEVTSDEGERTFRVADAADPTAVSTPALQELLQALGVDQGGVP